MLYSDGSGHGFGRGKQRFEARLELSVFGVENVAKPLAIAVTDENSHDAPLLTASAIMNGDS